MTIIDVSDIETRWGKVKHKCERLDGTYRKHSYEGPRSAVMVAVADFLKGATQQYEHMRTIDSVAVDEYRMIVACTQSNYAGD